MEIKPLQEEFHARDYLNILRRRMDVVILFFVATVLAVTIGSFIMKPVYRATATLLIDVESPNVLTTSGTVSLETQNYFSYKEYYQSQKEILTSDSIIRKVFNEFNLKDMEEYQKAKEPLKKFLKTVSVEPVRDTRLLELNVDNKDPALAAALANRIAEIYVLRNLYYISKNELMNLLKNEYLKLETRLSELNKIYKEGHPEMIKLRQEMVEVVDKIEKEKRASSTYDIDDREDSEAAYKYALEGLKANNVSIQDPAQVPILPVKPKKTLNILLSIIFGLFGGVALAFFFEYLDDSAKTAEDVEHATKWPFLGNVPVIDGGGLKEFEKDLFVDKKPKDPIAEAYRSIRTRILFSQTEERPLKTILVTSPGPQEGKTITLCNLAIAMAQSQKKILVVDADMRKPRLHDVLKKENTSGLSNLLAGQARIEDVVHKTHIENLSLVTGGIIPPNPSELLASHRMAEFIGKLKEKFDFVLFDSPPIAIVTDAAIIAGMVDGTVIVVETGKTSRKVLGRIHQLLNGAKAHVIGAIMNRMTKATDSYYYYHSYYYAKPK